VQPAKAPYVVTNGSKGCFGWLCSGVRMNCSWLPGPALLLPAWTLSPRATPDGRLDTPPLEPPPRAAAAQVLVVPTDEELSIAQQTLDVVCEAGVEA
jgi:hypothetical protein